MADPALELRINGESFLDYKSATVSWSLETFARSFSFTLSDKWLQTKVLALPFIEGDAVQVYAHGTKVLDGFIDDIPIDYSDRAHSITVTGRSWSGHLVDCSAIHKAGSWRDVKLKTVAEELVKPYGMSVKIDPSAVGAVAKPFKRWAIEDEETVHGCIARMAKMRGLFLTSDAAKTVVVTKASPEVLFGALINGVGGNVKSGKRIGRWRERFSEYTVKSQAAGDDTYFGDAAGRGYHKETDPQVTTHRPFIIVSDGMGSKEELRARAAWERNVRAGRSRRLQYMVTGFRTMNTHGPLWEVNRRIVVNDSYLDFDGVLLTIGVSLTYSRDSGEITNMEVGAAEAFDVLIPPRKRSRRGGGPLW